MLILAHDLKHDIILKFKIQNLLLKFRYKNFIKFETDKLSFELLKIKNFNNFHINNKSLIENSIASILKCIKDGTCESQKKLKLSEKEIIKKIFEKSKLKDNAIEILKKYIKTIFELLVRNIAKDNFIIIIIILYYIEHVYSIKYNLFESIEDISIGDIRKIFEKYENLHRLNRSYPDTINMKVMIKELIKILKVENLKSENNLINFQKKDKTDPFYLNLFLDIFNFYKNDTLDELKYF